MFRFIHGYLPNLWQGQVNAGLVDENDGIRFCQNIMLKDQLKFNNLASKGSELFKILSDGKRVFYIDRLQGGCYIDNYDYDQELLNEYKKMLGDNFWGFQMHEWLSNYYNDVCNNLKELPEDQWTKDNIENFIFQKFPYPYLILESMTAEEMAEYGQPKTARQLLKNMSAIYKKRQKLGELIPADSYFLAYALEISMGAKRIMPEIGSQTPDTKIQVCYARGMTRGEGRSFGMYYEPWGGAPFSTCCYEKNKKNEWGIEDSKDFPFKANGPNGGSSRSLQKRLFLYAYLNNAEFISEEWGLCNVFTDWETFELSDYGKVKKEFIDFTRQYNDVGDKLAPFAVVLPKNLMVLDNVYSDDVYCGFKCESKDLAKVKKGIRELFTTSLEMRGCETHVLKHSDIPDVIDILNDGIETLSNYKYLIDLTCDDEFAKRHSNIFKIEEVKKLCREELPVYVNGNAHWLINECLSGGYYLTVFNHSGVERTAEKGDSLIEDCKTTVTIEVKGYTPTLCCGDAELNYKNNVYSLSISAGSFAFIKLK